MTVLVVGATGYVGRAVVERLACDGWNVIGAARAAATDLRLAKAGVTGVDIDLDAPTGLAELASRCSGCVFCPGMRGPDAERIEGRAIDIMAEALPLDAPIVYVSGCTVYGQTNPQPATEDDPVADNTKTRLEVVLMSHGRIKAMIVRPGLVWGREGGILARLAAHASKTGTLPLIERGGQAWSVVHVDDLAALIGIMLVSPEAGRTLNAATGPAVALSELMEIAAKAATVPVELAPMSIDDAVSLIGPVSHLLNRHAVVSAERAMATGWMPRHPAVCLWRYG